MPRAPKKNDQPHLPGRGMTVRTGVVLSVLAVGLAYIFGFSDAFGVEYHRTNADTAASSSATAEVPALAVPLPPEAAAYNRKMLALAHIGTSTPPLPLSAVSSTTPRGTPVYSASTSVSVIQKLWPVAAPYPDAGALLPFHRIVAYYGNFYSAQMGVLGEYPADEMLARLRAAVAEWQVADPSTPILPAIDYIAVTAQGSPGADGKYRLEMPDSQIDHALALADEVHGIVILDVQVGTSNLRAELPSLVKYLSLPNVHLAIDPEFSMKTGVRPGTVIGSFDATDVNYAANYLALLANQNNLPPKLLIVHRFTEDMVTNYEKIRPLHDVQIVMDMDGWGSQAKKNGTYNHVIYPEPVQFTGFKLFYKNDIKPPSTGMLSPAQVLSLTPQPIFIQYQ